MTKREQMLLAIAAQKAAARSPEKELPPLEPTTVPTPVSAGAKPDEWWCDACNSTCFERAGRCRGCDARCRPAIPETAKKPRPSPATSLGDRQARHGRLPDGAEFWARYDALAVQWYGKLTVTDAALRFVTFEADSSGVWKLMGKLDAMYRQHLKAQQPPARGQS